MAGERIKLEVKAREEHGSRVSRRLRRDGLIPGVLYGGGKTARSFVVEERELRRTLTGEHGLHAILDVVLEGEQRAHHAVLKDFQLDPTRGRLLHVDLHEVRLDRPIQAQVAIELVGAAPGVAQGGLLSQVVREVTMEALPAQMPDRVELDVAKMEIGDIVRVADLTVPEGARVVDDPEILVATVAVPRRVELVEEVVPEEEAAAVEGEAAEAEAGPEAEA